MPFDYSKIPHDDVTDTYLFVNLPRKFFSDREEGKITPMMFDVLAWVWAHAGYRTGIVERASAKMIQEDLWPNRKGRPSLSTVQRWLHWCAVCGYISLPKRYRHDENYPITAHGYVVFTDGRKLALWPKPTITYRQARKGCADPSADLYADEVRNLCRASAEAAKSSCGASEEDEPNPCGTCDDSSTSVAGTAREAAGADQAGEAGKEREQQQQPGAAAVFRLPPQTPSQTTAQTSSPASSLADWFWTSLGRRGRIPDKQRAQFSELESKHKDLPELLEFLFTEHSASKWLQGIKEAEHSPVGYLSSLLTPIGLAFDKRTAERRKAAARKRVPADEADSFDPDDETEADACCTPARKRKVPADEADSFDPDDETEADACDIPADERDWFE